MFDSMAEQRKKWKNQDISGKGVGESIPVITTHVRPSLRNFNPNTLVQRQRFNEVPISVPARVSSDATTRLGTS